MDFDGDGVIDVTEEELFELTEQMLDEDANNCARYFWYNLQERRQGEEDVCDEPLFQNIDEEMFEIETIKKLIALHDNYEPVVSEEEDVTREERQEEFDFLDACVDTRVMEIAHQFLVSKGILSSEDKVHFKRILHRMWFALYPRAHRVKGSCAFEHVFLGEVKRGKVSGFHNWLFFLQEERKGDLNYYGFNKAFGFGKNSSGQRNGGILKTVFEWENSIKPVSSIFIGLSPELELALYTLCVLMKPNDALTVSLGGKKIDIQTNTFRYREKKYLGTAFPDI